MYVYIYTYIYIYMYIHALALPSFMTLETFMSPILMDPSSARKQLAGFRSV